MSELNSSDKIKILISQVDCMAKGISEFRMNARGDFTQLTESRIELQENTTGSGESVTELRESIERGFEEVRSQLTELKAVSERQERNIDRLVGIVETLIQERQS